MAEAGEWVTDGKGVLTEELTDCSESEKFEDGQLRSSQRARDECALKYFCGFQDTEVGSAREKLMANGGTVWNVRPVGCNGGYGFENGDPMCQTRWTQEKYMVRSLAVGDQNMDGVVDEQDYRCLYFPSGVGSIPRMVPKEATADGVWLGTGGSVDVDADGDPNCGIALGRGGAAQNEMLKLENTDNGGAATDEETQEKELLINQQAIFSLVKLPNF